MRALGAVAAACVGLLAAGGDSASARVVGNGTARSCTSAAAVAAVRAGGDVRFACGPKPVTIALCETAKVLNTRRNPSKGFETRDLPGIFFLGAGKPAITDSILR